MSDASVVEFHPHPAAVPPINPNTCLTLAMRLGGALVVGFFSVVLAIAW